MLSVDFIKQYRLLLTLSIFSIPSRSNFTLSQSFAYRIGGYLPEIIGQSANSKNRFTESIAALSPPLLPIPMTAIGFALRDSLLLNTRRESRDNSVPGAFI